MKLKALVDEDFVNYKKPSMFIGTAQCDWKCCTEQGMDISMCQNSALAKAKTIDVPTDEIVRRYINNPITQAIVIGGLEPFNDFDDLYEFILKFREESKDDVVIYTGYTKEEVHKNRQWSQILALRDENIIIKYGRYLPNQEPHYDEVLSVYLASDNQYAERIYYNDKVK